MTRQTEAPKQPQTPVTLRRLPAKRAGATVCLVTLVLAGLWSTWSLVAGRRLQAKVAEIRGRQELLLPEEFDPSPVPANENAATFLKQAAASVMASGKLSPAASAMTYNSYPPFPPAWHSMASAAVAANPNALQLARKARQYDKVDWGVRYRSPVLGMPRGMMGIFNPARNLANFLGDAAVYAHEQGDDAEAIERIRDAWHEGWAMGEGLDEVGRLVDIGIQALADERLEVIAPDLRVEEDAAAQRSGPSGHPVSREVLRQIIRDRLDDREPRRQHRQSLLVERMEKYDAIRSLHDRATILRPMLNLEAVRSLNGVDLEIRAAEQSNWPAAKSIIAQWPVDPDAPAPSWSRRTSPNPPRYSRTVSAAVGQPSERFAEMEFRMIAERRVIALILAIRLYRADHGDWPPYLDALVSEYLPAVPADPFAPRYQQIGYVMQPLPSGAGKRPLLYFTDPDPRSGAITSPLPEPCFGWMSGSTFQWRDLSRWTPGK